MADAVNDPSEAATPKAVLSPMTQVVVELAAAAGMSPQQFVFGGIGLMLAPFEKQMADRIADLVLQRLTNTAEIGEPNATLQGDWSDTNART